MDLKQLTDLAECRGFPKITLYFPTHEKGPEVQQDPIRLKNALSEARSRLEKNGLSPEEIDGLLAEAEARTDKDDFWLHQSRGLAVFIDEESTRWHKLPTRVQESVAVGERFQIRPLLPIFGSDLAFNVLTLSQEAVALYDADRHGMTRQEVEGCPVSLEAMRGMTDFEGNIHFHSNAAGGATGGASGAPQYHAQGESAKDYDKVLFQQFVGRVANAVDAHLANSDLPLVVVGDPNAVGEFRRASDYRGLVEEAVVKNPQAMSEDEIHSAALVSAESHWAPEREAALERLGQSLGSDEVPGSDDLAELARAAVDGRIDTLFLDPNAIVPGAFDANTRKIDTSKESTGSDDLLNFIAGKTLSNGGRIVDLPEERASEVGPAAAILRY